MIERLVMSSGPAAAIARSTALTASLCSSISSRARLPLPKISSPRVAASTSRRSCEHTRPVPAQKRLHFAIKALGTVVGHHQQA
ncbi:MAG: hypothetical protein MZU95_11770 [Desulfomicrobium escambiense]|nr:hypothetical protein [Desulfomicrobium escambiense]